MKQAGLGGGFVGDRGETAVFGHISALDHFDRVALRALVVSPYDPEEGAPVVQTGVHVAQEIGAGKRSFFRIQAKINNS
jgi:hypothetical protein